MVSDRLRVRGPIILCLYPLNIIGYIMLIASADPQVQYAALFLVVRPHERRRPADMAGSRRVPVGPGAARDSAEQVRRSRRTVR